MDGGGRQTPNADRLSLNRRRRPRGRAACRVASRSLLYDYNLLCLLGLRTAYLSPLMLVEHGQKVLILESLLLIRRFLLSTPGGSRLRQRRTLILVGIVACQYLALSGTSRPWQARRLLRKLGIVTPRGLRWLLRQARTPTLRMLTSLSSWLR